jgi:cyclophilin family peptidyl-prolyl cis-trans isomerase/HEAT repeat protein
MLKTKALLVTLILLFTVTSVYSQRELEQLKNILELQQKRIIKNNDADIIEMLEEDNDDIVIAALLAIANIGDTSSNVINQTAKRLDDPEETVRYTAAFALGNLASLKAENHLLKALDKVKSKKVLGMIISSLGMIGSHASLDAVTLYGSKSDEVNSEIALAIARLGIRKIKDNSSFDKLFGFFMPHATEGKNVIVFKNIVYALNRIGDPATLDRFKPILMELRSSADPEMRMWVYSALGKTKDSTLSSQLINDAMIETDWRVKVNIINALGNINLWYSNTDNILGPFEYLVEALKDANEHKSIAAANAFGKALLYGQSDETVLDAIMQKLKEKLNDNAVAVNTKILLINVLASVYKDSYKSELFRIFDVSDDYKIKAAAISAFGNFKDPLIYKEVRDTISAEVQRYNIIHPNKTGAMIGSEELARLYRAFLEILLTLDDNMSAEDQNTVRLIYTEFLNSGDLIISSLAVQGITDKMYAQYKPETIQILMFDYPNLQTSDMRQLYVSALGELGANEAVKILEENLRSDDYLLAIESAGALMKITDKDYTGSLTDRYMDIDWQYLMKLNERKNVTLVTEKGNIEIELFPEFAPFTVMNFLKLAEKNFYNDIIFHRVLPNFVIQAGDPTGTGYSGPGYSIRTEIAPVGFETGYIGMASSGKDTEGSQFFITHSPQPHLNGRYTVFGRVINGMDVVNKIYFGDKIIRIDVK